jgi:hypothetical protein
MRSLVKDCKFVVAAIYASGTASVKAPATGVDMSGFERVCFVVNLATIAASAVASAKIQQSDTAVDDAGFVDITSSDSTAIVADDDDQIRLIEVQPTKRYVRLLLTKDATNAVAATVTAILFNADDSPVTQPTGTEATFVA